MARAKGGGECAIARRMLGQSGSGGACGAGRRDDLGLGLLSPPAGSAGSRGLEAPVVLPQDGYHFWPTEFGRDLLALRQHLSLARARDGEVVLRVVRAGLA